MITCPIDIKDRELVRQWLRYCMSYTSDISLDKPDKHSKYQGLMKYESYYKKLDLYYQLSMRLGKLVDSDWLEKEREKTQDTIIFSAGKIGYQVEVSPNELAKVIHFTFADLIK